jgi:hypothetical protein
MSAPWQAAAAAACLALAACGSTSTAVHSVGILDAGRCTWPEACLRLQRGQADEVRPLAGGEVEYVFLGQGELRQGVAPFVRPAGRERFVAVLRDGRFVRGWYTVQVVDWTTAACGGPLSGHGSRDCCGSEQGRTCSSGIVPLAGSCSGVRAAP